MTLDEIVVATINERGYLVIATNEKFPRLPFSLKDGLCQANGDILNSSSLYAYERTDLADYLEQRKFQRMLGLEEMVDPSMMKHYYRVRGD